MAEQWYYSRNGQRQGPVAGAALKQLASSGQLATTDLVWREGMAEWAPAARVKGLFPESVIAAEPPPLPPSPLAVADAPATNLDQRYNSLYCSSDDRMVLGLAGGLGHKFGVPPNALRVLFVIALFFVVGWAYLVGLFLPKLPTKGVPRPV